MISIDALHDQDDISLRITFADFRNSNAERYIIFIVTVSIEIMDVHLGAVV